MGRQLPDDRVEIIGHRAEDPAIDLPTRRIDQRIEL
jgi:hypothetical protein